jgi:hypothetical protein
MMEREFSPGNGEIKKGKVLYLALNFLIKSSDKTNRINHFNAPGGFIPATGASPFSDNDVLPATSYELSQ